MLYFTEFLKKTHSILLEGGNSPGAQKIDLSLNGEKRRSYVIPLLKEFFNELNKQFEQKYHIPLWSQSVLQQFNHLAGSTKHFMDPSVENFSSFKKDVGDIDLLIANDLRDQVVDFLSGLTKGKKIAQLTFNAIHETTQSKTAEPAALITQWKLPKDPEHFPEGLLLQLDFNFIISQGDADYTPIEWSTFYHSSDLTDMKQGIKGAFHKILLRAISAKHHEQNIYTLGKSGKLLPKELEKYFSLSPEYGLRIALLKVDPEIVKELLNPSNPNSLKNKDLIGKDVKNLTFKTLTLAELKELQKNPQKMRQLFDSIKKTDPNTDEKNFNEFKELLDFQVNLKKIFTLLFGKEPTENDLILFQSFLGLVCLINKYLSADKQFIIDKFIELLFGYSAYKTKGRENESKLDGQFLSSTYNETTVKKDRELKMLPLSFLLSKGKVLSNLTAVPTREEAGNVILVGSSFQWINDLADEYGKIALKVGENK